LNAASKRKPWSSLRLAKYIRKCDAHFDEHESRRERSVDSTEWLPAGEIRGLTKLVKITEDVRKYGAEQGVSEHEALHKGMEEKSREFTKSGAELYAKA
jgi:hypothetical protein